MSYLIGRRGHTREAYPQSPGAGGGGTGVPLSRQRFIDGDTTNPGPGAASSPFATIANFIASRPSVSNNDATANYVGWVMPALNGYIEDVAFPAYASTELRADSFSVVRGTVVTGNVSWANIGPTFTASDAVVALHNISVSGGFIVTDDAGAPPSSILFSGDEVSDNSVFLGGSFNSSTTQKLSSVVFSNAIIQGNIDTGNASPHAQLILVNSEIAGNITTRTLEAINSEIASAAILLDPTDSTSRFLNCIFATETVLTALSSATFDGPSWLSFVEEGGTRGSGDAATPVLVVGGYNSAAVEGANLPLTAGPTNVTLNGGINASTGYKGANSGNHYSVVGALSADSVVVLKTGGGELTGDTILISRTDSGAGFGAHTLAVKNNAGTVIGTIPNSSRGFVLATFNGSDWVFTEGGSLLA